MKKLSFYLTLTLLSLAVAIPFALLSRFMNGTTDPAGILEGEQS